MTPPLLTVDTLRVSFSTPDGLVRALDGVSFTLGRGESLAIVGETGSGKTTLARALLGLHPHGSTHGRIIYDGRDLNGQTESLWESLRWRHIALAVQNAGTGFNPVHRVGEQITEPMRVHLGLDSESAWAHAVTLAQANGLEERHLRAYPHQLSGGEKQRAMLTMALSCDPDLLILDEPTSGQDVHARARMIDLLTRIRSERAMALILISHDLAAAAALTEQTAVLYAGQLVEMGASRDVFSTPRHPYTWGLLNAYPNMTTTRDLSAIRGQMPNPLTPPDGCRFHPRCTQAVDSCRTVTPPLESHEGRRVACHLGGIQTLLRAEGLRKAFTLDGGARTTLEALRGVSLAVLEGEVVGVVGETGSGKTTLGRVLVGLLDADAGTIHVEGQDLSQVNRADAKRLRARIQSIPQDPFESVSPLWSVAQIVREPLEIQRVGTASERDSAVRAALEAVGLPSDAGFGARRAQDLSGGQLQRVVIARALIVQPKLLIADEPVSMLDPSEQARLMLLLRSLQNARGMGLLLISHDLALVRKVADRIVVMRAGEIVEQGASHRVMSAPQHAYTRSLIDSAPRFG